LTCSSTIEADQFTDFRSSSVAACRKLDLPLSGLEASESLDVIAVKFETLEVRA
jgi:hypothetical protein